MVVAGGFTQAGGYTSSTVLVDLGSGDQRRGAGMVGARGYFGVGVLGGQVVAVGGFAGTQEGYLASEEEEGEDGGWQVLEQQLEEARSSFGTVVVARERVCAPTEDEGEEDVVILL